MPNNNSARSIIAAIYCVICLLQVVSGYDCPAGTFPYTNNACRPPRGDSRYMAVSQCYSEDWGYNTNVGFTATAPGAGTCDDGMAVYFFEVVELTYGTMISRVCRASSNGYATMTRFAMGADPGCPSGWYGVEGPYSINLYDPWYLHISFCYFDDGTGVGNAIAASADNVDNENKNDCGIFANFRQFNGPWEIDLSWPTPQSCLVGFTGDGADNENCCHPVASCTGHGICDTDATCWCNDNFAGEKCDRCDEDCYGYPNCTWCVPGSVNGTCNGGGCNIKTGACICLAGWAGDYCDECAVNQYGSNCSIFCNANATCNLHGTCDKTGKCKCKKGFTGTNCDQCATGYALYPSCVVACSPSTTCSAHGRCNANNTCDCLKGYSGTACDRCADGSPLYPLCSGTDPDESIGSDEPTPTSDESSDESPDSATTTGKSAGTTTSKSTTTKSASTTAKSTTTNTTATTTGKSTTNTTATTTARITNSTTTATGNSTGASNVLSAASSQQQQQHYAAIVCVVIMGVLCLLL